ncbi:Hypothetical protein, putative [Bodo saltans]|uniref:Uncharacterized protein n=1 Tax=Bodo saltans TaxID=75058 RepID=A0A0S4IUM4_BODSA|nr:Hypothetical protein, putative [Bodo saltans]|eukprot:CUF98841.1 Hypothetical protein, putative [Bodo saltans]
MPSITQSKKMLVRTLSCAASTPNSVCGETSLASPKLRQPIVLENTKTEHLNGNHHLQGTGGGYSVSAGALMEQTEVATFTYPEALLARAAVLDYFDELVRFHPTTNVVLKMEEGICNAGKEYALSKMLKQIAAADSKCGMSMGLRELMRQLLLRPLLRKNTAKMGLKANTSL